MNTDQSARITPLVFPPQFSFCSSSETIQSLAPTKKVSAKVRKSPCVNLPPQPILV